MFSLKHKFPLIIHIKAEEKKYLYPTACDGLWWTGTKTRGQLCGFSKLCNWGTLRSTKFSSLCSAGEIKCISSETGLSFPRLLGHVPIKVLIFSLCFQLPYHILLVLISFCRNFYSTLCNLFLCLSSQEGNCLGFHNWISPINMARKERSLQGTLQGWVLGWEHCLDSATGFKVLSPDLAPPENRDKFVISLGRAEITAIQNALTHS